MSFSAVPLDELIARRHFQSHLGRWDWEPYGLLLDRQALEQLGARPVIYGQSSDYEALADHERPFFQPAKRRRAGRRPLHWESESEWRLIGDLRLGDLPRHAVHVFVSQKDQAEALSLRSRWPVIWLHDDLSNRVDRP